MSAIPGRSFASTAGARSAASSASSHSRNLWFTAHRARMMSTKGLSLELWKAFDWKNSSFPLKSKENVLSRAPFRSM